MIKANQRKWFLFYGFLLAAILLALPQLNTIFYHEITAKPNVQNGEIELSTENPNLEKIYLDGQWKFYWENLLITEPKVNTQQELMMNVPDSWSNYQFAGKNLSTAGFGSYKLSLLGLAYDKSITIYLPSYGGAYRVFIDGQLTSTSGNVSSDISKIFTIPHADLYPVKLAVGLSHEVVIEVATTRFSGLYMTPVLSDYQNTVKENNFRKETELVLFGILLFAFFSLLAMYGVTIRRKLNSIWLPMMIFFIMIRIMLTAGFYDLWQPVLFANLSYESTNELMFLTTFVLKYLVIFLVQEQCGIAFSKKEKLGFFIYYLLLYIIYLVAPQDIYNNYLSLIIPMLTYVLDLYILLKIYQNWHMLRKFGLIIWVGVVLLIIGLTVDSYYLNGKIYLNIALLLPLSLTIFSIIMSWVYAMRMGDFYDDFMESSLRLELINRQLTMQKDYYEGLNEQMKEVREMKHDIRYFIGVMSQMAAAGELAELQHFLGEYDQKTANEQLPIFCEHQVANSIIGYYYLQAKKAEITIESKCKLDKISFMSDSDICIILGNGLENALEACKQMPLAENRFVSLEIATVSKQLLFKIRNSYCGGLEINNGRYISSKQDESHGLGIRNIEKIVEAYGGFIKIEHDDKEFMLFGAIPENK
ncbi:MAG: GHKL domain-containing protein [Clostridia bacterium]